MELYQKHFIQLALKCQALKFGEFTLKSGRISPYFFNAGQFQSGSALANIGRCYAQALKRSAVSYDMLFGPAYKGIPLAAATAIALADQHDEDVPYCFNRKEAKTHGEGGSLVGSPLAGRVVVVDDVITAGTAVREVLQLIEHAEATPAAILIGLNRQEKGLGERSAIQEIEEESGVPVISIIDLKDIMVYLEDTGAQPELIKRMANYRHNYGVQSN